MDEVYSEHYNSDGGGSNLLHNVSPSQVLKAGLVVIARYKGRRTWLPGTITRKNGDGTFDIRYDDGEEEMRVESNLIQVTKNNYEYMRFTEGDEIQCNYKGKGQWLRGGISHVNKDGTYDIHFDNGYGERYVESNRIQIIRKTTSRAREIKKETSKPYYTSRNELRTALDGNVIDDADYAGKARKKVFRTETTRIFKIDDEIEGNYRGYGRWLKGKISYVNMGGTYNVQYNDGDKETGVSPSYLRLSVNTSKEPPKRTVLFDDSDVDEFGPGDEIESNFKGRGRWFRGKIDTVNKDRTYDILYDDGDRESGVHTCNIRGMRQHGGKSRDPLVLSTYKTGDSVEAKYKGRGQWLEGKIYQVDRNGTYSVRFSNGNIEKGIVDYNIRSFSAQQIGRANKTSRTDSESFKYNDVLLTVGKRVEGNYKGKGHWYKGKVTRLNVDGTYDLLYEDGDTEKRVTIPYIRSVSGESLSPRNNQELLVFDSAITADFMEGDRVQFNYNGKGTWVEGEISYVNRDGTYDLQFNGEDRETCVSLSNIRRPINQNKIKRSGETNASHPEKKHLKVVGDKIECNYRGGGRWFKGEIFKVNTDGTYDILYDDGDRECSVEWFNIRNNIQKRGSNNNSPSGYEESDMRVKDGPFRKRGDDSILQVGDEIEARCQGQNTWYKGTIVRKNKDETFHISYVDGGDEEYFVDRYLIRKCSNAQSALERSNSPPLQRQSSAAHESNSNHHVTLYHVGEEVQGNYKGKDKWYKCKIEKVNVDGTYRLKYSDGDVEDHVKVSCLSRSSSSSSSSSTETTNIDGSNICKNKKMGYSDIAFLQVGDDIEGNYKGKGRWIRGLITHVNGEHQSYDICYKTGIEEYGVKFSNIRPFGQTRSSKTYHRKSVRGDDDEGSDINGTALLANSEGSSYEGNNRMWTNENENFNLNNRVRYNNGKHSYNDGGTESDNDSSYPHTSTIIHSKHTHHHNSGASKMSHAMGSPSSNNSKAENLKLFDTVKANYKGTGRWLRGKICRIHGDGSAYDILYEKNKYRENYVKSCHVHSVSQQPKEVMKSEPNSFRRRRIGDEVEINNNEGKSNKWQRGTICRVHQDGSYRIEYAVGGTEDVLPSNIRSIMNKHPKKPRRIVSDSDSEEREEGFQPYQPSQKTRQRLLHLAPTKNGSETEYEEFNNLEGAEKKQDRELNSSSSIMESGSDTTTKGSSSAYLVSERLWFVLSSVALGGVDVKKAPRGILREAFESVDKDNDGLISSLQLYKLLKRLDTPSLDEEEVNDLFIVMDYNRDGLVSLSDIVELALWDPKGTAPSDVLAVFKRLTKEATTNIKPSRKKRIVSRGNASSGSVYTVKCVEDALAGERSTRWSEIPRRLATVGITIRTYDVDTLACVLDTEETGRVPSEVFAVWLCSGLDMTMLKQKVGHLLREIEDRGVDPEMVLKRVHKQSGGKGRGGIMSEAAFMEGLRMLGMPLTQSQLSMLINIFTADVEENNSGEGFDHSQTGKQMKKEVDVIQFLSLSSEKQLLLHCDSRPHSSKWWKSSKSSLAMGSKVETTGAASHHKRDIGAMKHKKNKKLTNQDNSENDVSGGEGSPSAEMLISEDHIDGNQEVHYDSSGALFDRKTLKALWSLAIEDASEDSNLRAKFIHSNDVWADEAVIQVPIKRCEKILRKQLGSKVSKNQLHTVIELLSKFQEIKTQDMTSVMTCHNNGGQVLIPLLDIMELSLSQESSHTLADLHNRMAKDLASKFSKMQKNNLGSSTTGNVNKGKQENLDILLSIISSITKPFKSFDRTAELNGFVTSKAFKKGLTKLGCGMLKDSDKTHLVQHFDVNKEGMINYEQFAVWLASGLDSKRLKNKMECLREMLKTKKGVSLHVTLKRMAEKEQQNNYHDNSEIVAEKVCQCLRKILGFPLTQGEMRALLTMYSTRSSRNRGDGIIDINLLLNGLTRAKTGRINSMLKQNKLDEDHHTASDICDDICDAGVIGTGCMEDYSGCKDHHQGNNVLLEDCSPKSETNNHQMAKQDVNTGTTDKKERMKKYGMIQDQKVMSGLSATVGARAQELMAKGCEVDWEVKFDSCSGAESGFVNLDNAVDVIVKMGIPVSSSQKAVLGKRLCNDRNSGGETGLLPPSLPVRSLVRWLEACNEIDTHILWNVQRYFKGRLGKSFGIQDLFSDISAGRRYLTPKRLTKVLKGTKAQLSRVVIELLVDMFDADGE